MLSIIVNGNSITDRFNYADATTTTTLPGVNFGAAGDCGCTDDTTDIVNNIIDKSPECLRITLKYLAL